MEELNKRNRTVLAVAGPTAVGKTAFTIRLANIFGGEIVSCDSMQLYKFMDIGSAKPTPEEQAAAKHYLVDRIDPREPFSAAVYQKLAKEAIETVFAKGKLPVIEGGTGLYLNALLYDMDFSAPPAPAGTREKYYKFAEERGNQALWDRLAALDRASASRIHPNNVKKVVRALEAAESGRPIQDFSSGPKPTRDYRVILTGIERNRDELYQRIDLRVDLLMEAGLEEEVRGLLDMGLTAGDISMKGIGYKELIGYFEGKYDRNEAVRLIKRNTRHLAKHQMNWFRRYSDMKWFNVSDYPSEGAALADMTRYIRERLEAGE